MQMSEASFPHRIRVNTTTLKSGIAFGMASLGAIPIRYGQPRFPVLRRRFQDDNQEQRLLKLGKDSGQDGPPEIFGLADFNSLGKQTDQQQGNQAALRAGVNFSKTNGERSRLSGSFVQVTCTANIYANSIDPLFAWIESILELPTIRGLSEFADGRSVPVTAEITRDFDWTNPVPQENTGMSFTDRLFNISVNFTVRTVAARIETQPLFKGAVVDLQVDGEALPQTVEIPAVDPDDWP